MQIQHAFGIVLDKGVVKRVLDKHHKPTAPFHDGPSWLTFLGYMKDSLWSVDLFRCESIALKSYWVMLLMDQFNRGIVGISVRAADINGVDVCCMFNSIITKQALPKYISSDNDPLFRCHRWQANLRILDITEIKSVPHTPQSHPFVERLIGTIRREYLDQLLFWNERDLKQKLDQFNGYYNTERAHSALNRKTPEIKNTEHDENVISFATFRWKSHAQQLFHLPIAA
jgi:putative transposase